MLPTRRVGVPPGPGQGRDRRTRTWPICQVHARPLLPAPGPPRRGMADRPSSKARGGQHGAGPGRPHHATGRARRPGSRTGPALRLMPSGRPGWRQRRSCGPSRSRSAHSPGSRRPRRPRSGTRFRTRAFVRDVSGPSAGDGSLVAFGPACRGSGDTVAGCGVIGSRSSSMRAVRSAPTRSRPPATTSGRDQHRPGHRRGHRGHPRRNAGPDCPVHGQPHPGARRAPSHRPRHRPGGHRHLARTRPALSLPRPASRMRAEPAQLATRCSPRRGHAAYRRAHAILSPARPASPRASRPPPRPHRRGARSLR